jgi:hypothetical protein
VYGSTEGGHDVRVVGRTSLAAGLTGAVGAAGRR